MKNVAFLVFLFMSLGVLGNGASAGVVNGDFSTGLGGWATTGNVDASGQTAVLGDASGADYSSIYQGVALAAGNYRLEFDFLNGLSADVPSGVFRDVVFASLYFIDDISQFDPVGLVFDDGLALFDLDVNGVANSAGTVGASAKGGDWRHFSISFNNSYGYVIPTLEFFNQNGVSGDSTVGVDNIAITPLPAAVPEPPVVVLLLAGALGAVARRKYAR
ncbi:PEP-CTERM sorting domain-containing protein [Methylococcus sp. EFPC2]|uniref:PEP-CTERM sorting domain-containing protein n=1 Tax=Methylococcus sp. EFPC2 TaxID=2812648 RepID=UPI001968A44D|nr:PEP-CTERM sorting domain-containing protein [Methylococcus sp. EFPC2]QSA98736.1 PEP-CTERM sorting domain-containing protein [Methylococcus sp. EFPC2]